MYPKRVNSEIWTGLAHVGVIMYSGGGGLFAKPTDDENNSFKRE